MVGSTVYLLSVQPHCLGDLLVGSSSTLFKIAW